MVELKKKGFENEFPGRESVIPRQSLPPINKVKVVFFRERFEPRKDLVCLGEHLPGFDDGFLGAFH
ncbi:MAG: hypothetical protein QE273_08920 [Verrucomicrobiales bacterium]|nr:hypothetical protein [Verrucomicrobiales bacterium]